jgi:chemotaxis protein MotA
MMSAIIGMVMGILIIIGANFLEGDPLQSLVKGDAFLIVFGGTFAALLVHVDYRSIITAGKQLSWLVKPPPTDTIKLIQDMYSWSGIARSKGFLALESVADEAEDQFIKTGLTMVVASAPYEDLRDVLYQIGDVEDRENSLGGEVWESAGGYAPTIGVLGAVMGLIHVMLNLSHPAGLGPGIATAFVATVYGVGSANLIFFPLGNRLKSIGGGRSVYREVATEGLLLLSKQVSPIRLRERLENMLESRRRPGLNDEANATPETAQQEAAA